MEINAVILNAVISLLYTPKSFELNFSSSKIKSGLKGLECIPKSGCTSRVLTAK